MSARQRYGRCRALTATIHVEVYERRANCHCVLSVDSCAAATRGSSSRSAQHGDNKIREPALLYAIAPHIHLLGHSITVELNPGTPGARMLHDQQEYDVDDQFSQLLTALVRLTSGREHVS